MSHLAQTITDACQGAQQITKYSVHFAGYIALVQCWRRIGVKHRQAVRVVQGVRVCHGNASLHQKSKGQPCFESLARVSESYMNEEQGCASMLNLAWQRGRLSGAVKY